MSDIFNKLKAPFPPDRVSWRIGTVYTDNNGQKTEASALCYIDSRDVQERLDEVVGPGNWQNRYPHADKKTICEIGIRIDGINEWIWKSDGAGDSDIEAEKGALSDAFKRAAVHFGIGRYLYDIKKIKVKIIPSGRSFKIRDDEYPRLRKLLDGVEVDKPDTLKRKPAPPAANVMQSKSPPLASPMAANQGASSPPPVDDAPTVPTASTYSVDWIKKIAQATDADALAKEWNAEKAVRGKIEWPSENFRVTLNSKVAEAVQFLRG